MKKLLSILLCTALIFSMLGCQSEEDEPVSAAVPETTAEAAPPEPAAPETVPETEPATAPTAAPTEPPKPWENNIMITGWDFEPSLVFEKPSLKRDNITTITFLDTLANMPEDAQDVSAAKDRSVMAWLINSDMYIAGEGGVMANEDSEFLFGTYRNLTALNLNGNFHTENVKNMRWMFEGCAPIEEIDLSTMDVSNVLNMTSMFDGCKDLKTIHLGNWDTSKVVDMTNMFRGCKKIETLDVGNWNTSNVASMKGMFNNCWNLQQLDLSNFDTSNVMDMNGMFSWCGKLEKVDVSGWDTSNVTDMGLMFAGCPLTEMDVSHFNTSNVVRMTEMFVSSRFTSIDLSSWDTSKVLDMTGMFDDCMNLTDVNLGTWEVDSVGRNYRNFLENKVKIDGRPWSELFANAGTAEPKTTVPTSNVIPEPGIPEGGYHLSVRRNLPLSISAKFAQTDADDPNLPDVENMMIDDIPVLLCAGASSDSMPITIYLHGGGGCKEDNMTQARYTALNTGGYAICIDGGAYGESPRGPMSDGETICMSVTDIDKVIAFCSTLPGADLGRISLHGASMGGCSVLSYLARGSFKPIYASAMVPRADYTTTPPNAPVYGVHGAGEPDDEGNQRDIPPLASATIKQIMADYSPLQFAQNMMDTMLCVSVGLQDDQDAVLSCQALEAKFQELGKENCQFHYYESGHSLPGEAYDTANQQFLDALQTLPPMINSIPSVTITTIPQ